MNLHSVPAVAVLAVSSAFCVGVPPSLCAQQSQVAANSKVEANS